MAQTAASEAKARWDPELYEARHAFVWKLGEALVGLLEPKRGERILDVGCGPGQLTAKIAERGSEVVGLDASAEMIGQARQNFPRVSFVLQNAARMEFENEFDAVFSNAALHWMLEADAVAAGIGRALRRGGRLVAEMGGRGNIQTIVSTIEATVSAFAEGPLATRRNFYPTIGEYASVLERSGLEVRSAMHFERPTPLEGEAGMEHWIRQFKWSYYEGLPLNQRERALKRTVEALRPKLHLEGKWYADYRRLRITAVKV